MYKQIKQIFKNNMIEDVTDITSPKYYYFYQDYTCKSIFGVSKTITTAEYQLLQTMFVEKRQYTNNKKEQQIYEYLFEEKENPFKTPMSFIIYLVNKEDEDTINSVIKDIYRDVIIIKYMNFTVAFSTAFNDVEMTFRALTSDIGYEINVHQGFVFTSSTKGIELSKYFDYYKTNITTHGYTKIVDIIINANNKDQEVLMIIKNNVLDKLQKLPHMVDLIESFCNNNLNISLTSKLLYMHRNTVINKLDQIEKLTGLNIQKFKDAYAIKILIDLKN